MVWVSQNTCEGQSSGGTVEIPDFQLFSDTVTITGTFATLNRRPLGDAVNGTAFIHTTSGAEEHTVDLIFLSGQYIAQFADDLPSELDGLSATVTYLTK